MVIAQDQATYAGITNKGAGAAGSPGSGGKTGATTSPAGSAGAAGTNNAIQQFH
jgi:hypothetical protein